MKKSILFLVLIMVAIPAICRDKNPDAMGSETVTVGAERFDLYIPMLEGKKVGIMGNQTSVAGGSHLADALLERDIDLVFVFAPEHGFRGSIERGVAVGDGIDHKTGLPVYSLYGESGKADSLVSIVDVMLFDLQDVGARFYTYIASMHKLMQLCANNGKKLIILDRPNPNGDQVDGPVRKSDRFKSDVSYHKIAMIHGLTVGELAMMINGENWLSNGTKCDLEVIPVNGYTHKTLYRLPVIPSPSLPDYLSVRLYMSLCLFEGTDISIGRGTDFPFQVIGYPDPSYGDFTFIPNSRPGMSAYVEQKDKLCYGVDLRSMDPEKAKFTLQYILDFYRKMPEKFFANADFFDKLAGTDELRKQIIARWSEKQIRKAWEEELKEYKSMRKKYLLYEDFE